MNPYPVKTLTRSGGTASPSEIVRERWLDSPNPKPTRNNSNSNSNPNPNPNPKRLRLDAYHAERGYVGQGQGMYDIGKTEQQAPWNALNNINNAVSPYTGLGTTNQSSTGGGGAMGAVGGAIAANQLYRNLWPSSNLGFNDSASTTNGSSNGGNTGVRGGY